MTKQEFIQENFDKIKLFQALYLAEHLYAPLFDKSFAQLTDDEILQQLEHWVEQDDNLNYLED